MAAEYLHLDVTVNQAVHPASAALCGDVVAEQRTAAGTIVIVADGLGHGAQAHVTAHMHVARLAELLRQGIPLRRAFAKLVATLEDAKGNNQTYAALTALRVLADGVGTVLSYDMPAPVLLGRHAAQLLLLRRAAQGRALVGEANLHLAPGEGVLVVSDGVTMAGLGERLRHGWTEAGVAEFARERIRAGLARNELARQVLEQARTFWGERLGDDCTAVAAICRKGNVVTIISGPPTERSRCREFVDRFLGLPGTHVVCGGTTAEIVAAALGKSVTMATTPRSLVAPMRYEIEGVDLVTEGAVTLNQACNLLDANPDDFTEDSGVTELCRLLRGADRINLLVGGALNPATRDISFRQKGILTRHAIVPMLADKLRAAGKLVVEEHF